jgi:Protein of unknown function (DUF3617)
MSTTHVHRSVQGTASGLLLVFVIAAIFSLTVLAQTPSLRPGNYEKTEEISMAGRPSKSPPRKAVVCLGDQDVKDLGKIPIGDNAKQVCMDSDQKVAGTTITLTRSCTVPDGSKIVLGLTMTFTSAESYRGVATYKSASGPFKTRATITTTAKRIGDCKK